MICGLGIADKVIVQIQRLEIPLGTPKLMRLLLVLYSLDEID